MAAYGERRFDQRIRDLAVHDGCLFLAYGDGSNNIATSAGLTVEVRAFCDPDTPSPSLRYPTDEEDVHRFRIIGDTLTVAGPDAHDADEIAAEPAILGNLYTLRDGVWRKQRTVPGAEHVQDVALHSDTLYLVGSGADSREEWVTAGAHRYLWRSEDGGQTITTAYRQSHSRQDTRFLHLISTGETLYAFGYGRSSGLTATNITARGGVIAEITGGVLAGAVVWEATPLSEGRALLHATTDAGRQTLLLTADGAEPLPALDGARLVDVWWDAEEQAAWLAAMTRSAYGQQITLWRASADLTAPEIVLSFEHPVSVSALARWGAHLYIGDTLGLIYRMPTDRIR